MNKRFPGHRIPYKWIVEKVAECGVCQKSRARFENHVEEIYSHLKPAHHRARVGFDGLSVTPPDKDGNTHLIVFVDHYAKYVWAYVAKDYSAIEVAIGLFIYYCTFGVFDEVWTDSGSNILSDVVKQLNEWLQVRHVVALVDRHETNGVEGSNKQIVRHLQTLVHDLRIVDRWSDPIILCLVLFVINDQVNSETGVRPLDAKFGSAAGPYLRLPADELPENITNAWVVALDADLKHIRKISSEYQQQLVIERTRNTPVETQNVFQPGDLVFWERDRTKPRPTKLTAPNHGPWEVILQERNIVTCRHFVNENVEPLHVSRLRLFAGTPEEAFDLALRDAEQYVVTEIKAWKGDPNHRTSMQFWVEFDDGDAMWVSYKPDLVRNSVYQEYVGRLPQLFPLRFNVTDVKRMSQTMRSQPITSVAVGDVVYVDLRYIKGFDVFDKLGLPDAYFVPYVCECKYVRWVGSDKKKIEAKCTVLDVLCRNWDSLDVYMFGINKVLLPSMTLVTERLCLQYPSILERHNRGKLLKRYT